MNRTDMKKKTLVLICTAMPLLFGFCPVANGQDKVAVSILEKLDKIQSKLSAVHKFIFYEDFPSTGIRVTSASELIIDYSESASDKSLFEKELNHYLSQLGVGYISLPNAGEYVSDDVDMLGVFSVNCLHPATSITDYTHETTPVIVPFKPASLEGMQKENLTLFDFVAVAGSVVTKVDGEKYEWVYAKDGFNYRFTVEDKGNGYSVSLVGINRLKEYVADSGSVAKAKVEVTSDKTEISLVQTYTIWIKTSEKWYIAIRKEQTAVFLRLNIKPDGDINFYSGNGWYVKPQGNGFVRYPYLNGKWNTSQTKKLSAAEVEQALEQAQQEYIFTPGNNMSKDRVKLFERTAYFNDLDIKLP